MDTTAAGSRWAIATPHALATEAGAEAFERGGNAIDAALAAATTLAVVYPHMCGVGGDLFSLVQRPDGAVTAVNSSGRAPAGADADLVRGLTGGHAMPVRGPHTVTVPGAVAGWRALHDQGAVLDWHTAFERAHRYARDGAPVAPSLAETLAGGPTLAADPGMASVFFPGGSALIEGATFGQPALAATLDAIATEGPDAMYRGEIGRRYGAGLARAGVPIVPGDFEAHRADLLPPLRGRYRELDLSVVPPNSQGFVLVQILALVERLGIDPDPFGPDAAILARIMGATAADRDRHLADPDRMVVHPSTLLDDGHLAGLADEVRTGGELAAPRTPSGDTIALVTADAEGHAVSLIQSLFDAFGSGILEPATGIVAHDRGACFTLEPGHPNELRGGARPAHTLMPALAHREGRLAAVAGTMGGYAQPQINAMTLIRAFDLGMTPAEAVATPRWLVHGMDPSSEHPATLAEGDVPGPTLATLRDGGFEVDTVGVRDGSVGHAHLIRMTEDGLVAGSDPRSDGGALAG
ncbi:MAG TPA: gamma-glutamyltransferase [Actinomycetota bacterium]|jgi:gamma-glutamyltranspeptidase/glutathione hydrolase